MHVSQQKITTTLKHIKCGLIHINNNNWKGRRDGLETSMKCLTSKSKYPDHLSRFGVLGHLPITSANLNITTGLRFSALKVKPG